MGVDDMDTRVKEILRHKGYDVLTAEPDMTVYECIASMVKHNVGSILVMDGSTIAGIFTERDYLRRIVLKGRTSKTTKVREVMTTNLIRIEPSETVERCLAIMTQEKCRHLPVVDEDGELTGIVSIGDCVKQLSRVAQSQVEDLRGYIQGQYPG